ESREALRGRKSGRGSEDVEQHRLALRRQRRNEASRQKGQGAPGRQRGPRRRRRLSVDGFLRNPKHGGLCPPTTVATASRTSQKVGSRRGQPNVAGFLRNPKHGGLYLPPRSQFADPASTGSGLGETRLYLQEHQVIGLGKIGVPAVIGDVAAVMP